MLSRVPPRKLEMANEARPSTSTDDVDFSLPKSRRESSIRIANALIESGVLAAVEKNTSNKVHSHAKKILVDHEEEEGLSELVTKFNRLRQEQNVFKKMVGPNFHEAIAAKPKARIPDVNEEAIDPYDDGSLSENALDEEESADDPAKSNTSHRGSLKPGTMNTINTEYESFDYTETSSALQYIQATKRTAQQVMRTDFNRW